MSNETTDNRISYIDYVAYDRDGNVLAELVAVPGGWRFWRRELAWDVPSFEHASETFKWYPDVQWRAQLFITIQGKVQSNELVMSRKE